MEIKAAVNAFAALSQETRLDIFRLLVQVGPNGLTAGEIGQKLGVAAPTLSHHLAILERAGLLRSWRVQRHIHYATDFEGTRRLLTFLVDDCCGGRPELCGNGLGDAVLFCATECDPGPCGVHPAGGQDD